MSILFIDKPSGMTSFDVIRVLRRKLGIRKMGHAGTLDPLASGLLIVATEEDTKRLSGYLKLPKTYTAEIRIGESRSTGDIDGDILESKEVAALEAATVSRELSGMVGILKLPVPAYSAIKQGGVPLYKKARKGEKVDAPVRNMEVRNVELLDFVCNEGRAVATVRVDVASGVYIRSLAEELGRRLGYPSTIQALRRTGIGDFKVEDAQGLDS